MNCISCKSELIPDSANPDTDYQFDNALWIKFDGGYGMFVDAMPDILHLSPDGSAFPPSVANGWTEDEIEQFEHDVNNINRVVLCHDCAHKLCEVVPWINELLRPHNSHSHKTNYREQNPNHFGWDYDMYDEGGNRREM